ncbi:MAG TPA: O-antigen ligase family protein, partial [Gammaproteobacteria bacterium]|nr:O-antigen ligase family protein [Gammaproteobacteria bacterium]
LEMWRVAWQIFLHHPLMGAGSGAFMKETARMVETHDISPGITRYDHPHNDYFNAMVSWGVLGLVAYLLVLGLPLKLYIGAVRTGTGDRKAAGFVGIIMISGLLIFGLTETMFTHSIVMSWYVTFTAMLTAIMLRASARVGWEKQRTAA